MASKVAIDNWARYSSSCFVTWIFSHHPWLLECLINHPDCVCVFNEHSHCLYLTCTIQFTDFLEIIWFCLPTGLMLKIHPLERPNIVDILERLQDIAVSKNVSPKEPIAALVTAAASSALLPGVPEQHAGVWRTVFVVVVKTMAHIAKIDRHNFCIWWIGKPWRTLKMFFVFYKYFVF